MKHCLLICLTLLAAQAAAPEVEITSEPHHHLVFENKSVRVFNVEVLPNTETQMHWHRHDYVSINLGSAEIANNVKDKSPVSLKLQDGEVRFASASFAHFVRTVGDQSFRNVTIEVLEDEALRKATSPWDAKQDEDRALNILQGGTQQILFVKDAIRFSEFELQPGGVIPMLHHNGPQLLVAVSDLGIRSDVPRKASVAVHLKGGDSKWFLEGDSGRITNTEAKPAKFVTLEFP
jgi:hypothetical protein